MLLLLSVVVIGTSSAYAFFENQARYAFKHSWLPMLNDESPGNRFQAMRAFLTYPEWGLPILRNSMISPETGNVSWQIVMLIGMLGDPTDVPPLLKLWRELEDKKRSNVWLGAMQRLYWKTRISGGAPLNLRSLTLNYLEKDPSVESKEKTVVLLFRIDNPASSPRFIRVNAHFWKTRFRENLPTKYFWLPAGGRIESKIHSKFVAVEHTKNIRLDFRVWEVGFTKELMHEVVKMPIHKESTSSTDN